MGTSSATELRKVWVELRREERAVKEVEWKDWRLEEVDAYCGKRKRELVRCLRY